jgi:hypothetical protein
MAMKHYLEFQILQRELSSPFGMIWWFQKDLEKPGEIGRFIVRTSRAKL